MIIIEEDRGWRVIPETNNRYYASSKGDIYDTEMGRCVAQNKSKRGWMRCHYWSKGKRRTTGVHRLVMYAFYGISKLEVNHINGIKTDNRIENLEYVTTQENCIHRSQILKVGIIRKVYCYETDKVYDSIVQAGRDLGIKSFSHISDVCQRKQEHCYGYHFKYVDDEED